METHNLPLDDGSTRMDTPASETMHTGFRPVAGLSIRYAESEGQQHQSVLLTSPWPESLYAFQPIWQRLAQQAHLVAIDLPGFGRSEGLDALLSPQAMGEFVIRLIDAWRLDRPHLVGPDIGTAVRAVRRRAASRRAAQPRRGKRWRCRPAPDHPPAERHH